MITLEGRIVVSRALAHPGWRVIRLLVTPAAQAALRDALDAMPPDRRPTVEVLSAEELTSVPRRWRGNNSIWTAIAGGRIARRTVAR